MTTLETFQKLYEQTPSSDPLKAKAWYMLQQKGLPTKKWEAFRYVPLSELYASSWTLSREARREKSDLALVFIDGTFRPDLSTLPQEIIALPLKEARTSYGALLKRRFETSVQVDPDPFVLLNHVLYQEGLFLYLPPNQKLATPLEFRLIQTTPDVIACPKIDLFLGKGSAMTTVATYVQELNSWNNSAFHVTLEKGAELMHYENGTGVQSGFSFQATRALLKRDSNFRMFSFGAGQACHRLDIRVTLAEENSGTELKGLHLIEPKGKACTCIRVDHRAPRTRSYQHYKSVVSDRALASFAGTIYVAQEAQKTDAYQLNNNLLLGEKARAMSQPNLEVFADDVKASHGATCAELQAEELFYLRTRGLSIHDARKVLVQGFCRELTQQVTHAPLKAQIEQQVGTIYG